jgi:nicotinic acid phosphoribosyltransferase
MEKIDNVLEKVIHFSSVKLLEENMSLDTVDNYKNKITLNKLKELLSRHTIGIRHDTNKYTFLHVEMDFTNNNNTKPSTIREYKTHIFDENQLKMIFSGDNI